jgi:hypothetical protein
MKSNNPPCIKGFDAIKWSREVRDALSCKLNAMTPAEQDEYFRKALEEYSARQAARRGLAPSLAR